MIAFRVLVNGQQHVVASQSDWAILSLHVTAGRDSESDADDYITVDIGGLSKKMNNGFGEHFRWKSTDVAIGDRVEVEVIDTDSPDEPIRRYSADPKSDDIPYTDEEWQRMRYEDYLELKSEFEPEGGNSSGAVDVG